MCGRYVLSIVGDELASCCELSESPGDFRRFNIAPTQDAPVVHCGPAGTNVLTSMDWGFKLARRQAAAIKPLINARSETVAEKPTFKESVMCRRCLVPASGFYEWKKQQPYFIFLKNRRLMLMAGIWKSALENEQGNEFAIITTSAVPKIASLHERMPLLVSEKHWADWLEPRTDVEKLLAELRGQQKRAELDFYPVSPNVNSVKFDEEELTYPYSEPQESLF